MSENQEQYAVAVQAPMGVGEILAQVDLIQQVMKNVMRQDEHYGVIPGTGNKPSLLKPGAEKLLMTFRMVPRYEIQVVDLGNGHREYEITANLESLITGQFVGSGVGNCNTMETKYRYRTGPAESTGQPVPKGYWDRRKSDPKAAQALIGGAGYAARKIDGNWEIVIQGERVEHDNPADFYNTVKKMAKKRALVDAALTVTSASDIFTQDVEELKDNGIIGGVENAKPQGKPTVTPPQRKSAPKAEAPPQPAEDGARLISDAQRKRFYAIAKANGKEDEEIKSQVYVATGQESTKLIPVDKYEDLVKWAKAQQDAPPADVPDQPPDQDDDPFPGMD
jgi:hypothetical protein